MCTIINTENNHDNIMCTSYEVVIANDDQSLILFYEFFVITSAIVLILSYLVLFNCRTRPTLVKLHNLPFTSSRMQMNSVISNSRQAECR